MEAITLWVKNIVLVVVFACFLDLLLPNNSMQRFIKVIVGLFIMLAILNPLVGFFQNKWETEAALASSTMTEGRQSGDVTTTINNTVVEREVLAKEIYTKDLSKQIRTLVLAIQGVQEAKVAVELADEKNSKHKGGISKIKIYLKPGNYSGKSDTVEKIQPISVSDGEPAQRQNSQEEIRAELKNRIIKTVTELYLLSPEQVEIYKLF
ncbi:stage III sporulation protein AF [Propionispora hippei]|uniref:Stage III sporulation protein AF n=1 Tax=Propionispora hippei DSM 15287 TaxID=1123003 RepID=A0A1M6NJC8_9FIRM|nr:stage III sporulation protein AF [Propionispora hippei]SHJ95845.1 stage III sporulation protein AF [Propionispora hippei DSM 15287]